MLATIEDLHASDDLNSVKMTEIEQIQGFLTQTNSERSEAAAAVAHLAEKLSRLKSKSSIFNTITFSNYVAPLM